MEARTLFAALSLGLLASCAQLAPFEAVQNTNIRKAAQNARTRSDHDALTKYFEGAAREMQTKAEEQRKLLEHYEEKGYFYGRRAEEKAYTWALARKYEESAQANIKEAATHRRMALEAAQGNYAAQTGQ